MTPLKDHQWKLTRIPFVGPMSIYTTTTTTPTIITITTNSNNKTVASALLPPCLGK